MAYTIGVGGTDRKDNFDVGSFAGGAVYDSDFYTMTVQDVLLSDKKDKLTTD